jgi:hypothetical protein
LTRQIPAISGHGHRWKPPLLERLPTGGLPETAARVMIRIAISAAAFEALAGTLPLG